MALKAKMESGSSYVDPNMYLAMIASGKFLPGAKSKHPEFGDNFIWTLWIKGGTKEGEKVEGKVELTYYTPTKLTAKNKLGKLLAAVGVDVQEIDEGDEVDLEELLLKKKVKVLVEDNVKEEGTFSKITKILPFKATKKPTPKVEDDGFGDVEDEAPPKAAAKKASKPKDDDDVFDMDLDEL